MACVASTRVLGGWLWSRRSRWPCHGMSKVSVLFIDGGTHRKSGFVIGRYGNMILATRGASSALHSHLPPSSFRRGPLSSLGTLPPHPHHRALQPSPERERERENLHTALRPSPKTNITLHLVTACKTCCVPHETLYLTAFVSPMSEKRSRPFTFYLLPRCYYPRICGFFSAIFFYSFFFFEKFLWIWDYFERLGDCVLRILLSWKEFRNSFDSSNDDVIWVKMFIFEILYNAWLYKL